MSVAPHSGIIDFGTFTPPATPLDGIQGEVPAPLVGQEGYVLSASGWVPGGSISGLGTMSTQNADNVAITGGSINGTTIGASSPSTGIFTTLTATGQTSLGGAAGSEAFRAVTTASSSAWLQAKGSTVSASNGTVEFAAVSTVTGSDGIGINYAVQNLGIHAFKTGAGKLTQMQISGVAGAVNYWNATGSATTQAPIFSVAGSDSNISQVFQSKGTGAIDLAAGSSGVNISNGGTVTAITRTATGSGYTSPPTVTISPPTTAGGVQATATVVINTAGTPTVSNGGTGYTVGDVLSIVGGTPVAVAGTLTVTTVSGGVITAATYTNFAQYTAAPTNPVSVIGGTGSGATFTISFGISATFTITNAGSGYVEQPTVTFSGGGGSGAAAYATVGSSTVIRSLGVTGNASFDFHTPASVTNTVPALRIRDFSVGTSNTGFVQIQNANGYSQIIAQGPTNANLFIASNGTGSINFNTNSTSETNQLRVTHTASAVNYVQVTGAATGNRPAITAQGSDATAGLSISAKGTGNILFFQQGSVAAGTNQTFQISNGGSANYLNVTPANAGSAPSLSVLGSDTNIGMVFQSKGTGAIDLAAGSSGVNISNGGTVTAITRTAAGSNYTSPPTVAISAPTTSGGVQATATIPLIPTANPAITSGGTGYTVGDVLTFVGGTGTAAQMTVTAVSSGVITAATNSNTSAYSVVPSNPISVTGGTGSGATFTVSSWSIGATFTITNAGSGYVEQPTVTFSGGGGSGAAAYATVGTNVVISSTGAALRLANAGGIGFQVGNAGTATVNYLSAQGSSAGNPVLLSAAGSDSNIAVRFSSLGTSPVSLFTNNSGQEQLRVAHTASAVNYVQVTGSATGSIPVISSQGSDANVSLYLAAKGAGTIRLSTNTTSATQVRIPHTANAVNFFDITGGAAGSPVTISASTASSDTDIDLSLTPKGTGLVRFGTYTAGIITATGYINIKAADGTTYKLLVST